MVPSPAGRFRREIAPCVEPGEGDEIEAPTCAASAVATHTSSAMAASARPRP
uniref:Uncharacterized protein n=1 Tax=Arundo donax TaxID=35708 RepID=A0A0A8ZLR5_ARUDO